MNKNSTLSGPFSGFPARQAFHVTKQKALKSDITRKSATKQTPKVVAKDKCNSIRKQQQQRQINRQKWTTSDITILQGLSNCKQDYELFLKKIQRQQRITKYVNLQKWGIFNSNNLKHFEE